MRPFIYSLLGLALFFAGCASAPKQPLSSLEIKEIKPRYIEDQQFMRISEYLNGTENMGDRIIVRTDPTVRSGYYFTLILDEEVRRLPKGATITGEFYTPKSVELQTHKFILPKKLSDSSEIMLGLTGDAWPKKDAVPGAWRFTIRKANGEILAQKQSFLWSL